MLLFCLALGTLNAHEHWLFTELPAYSSGDSVTVVLRSGHSVGESEFLIETKLIQQAVVIGPDNMEIPIDLHPEGTEHIGSFQVLTPGTYTVLVNLRKRSKGPFIYLLKTRIQVGPKKNGSIPTQELEIIKDETTPSFSVFAGGDRVKAPIMLLLPDGSDRSLIMDRDGKSSFFSDQTGFYVAICHFRRQTASYSFHIGQ